MLQIGKVDEFMVQRVYFAEDFGLGCLEIVYLATFREPLGWFEAAERRTSRIFELALSSGLPLALAVILRVDVDVDEDLGGVLLLLGLVIARYVRGIDRTVRPRLGRLLLE
jgi:hypothetical protein